MSARLNQAGNALLQVMVILFVLGLGVYFLSDRLITQKNVVLQTSSVLRVRFALQSTMDYVYYLVQRRYCLDENLLQAPNCELNMMKGGAYATSTGQLLGGNARSLERILLSNPQTKNMSDMIQWNCVNLHLEPPFVPHAGHGGTADSNNCDWPEHHVFPPYSAPDNLMPDGVTAVNEQPPVLAGINSPDSIHIEVPAANISGSNHPLRAVLEPLDRAFKQDAELKKRMNNNDLKLVIAVTIKRETAGDVPVTGNEVFFTVKVEFKDDHGNLLIANRVPLRVSSYGTMFPRELGSFSLLVPRGISLDGNVHEAGDVVFPDNALPTDPGINFKSPVFANASVHLPHGTGSHHAAGKYSPVTFSDRLILGNGMVMENGAPYKPDTAGGKKDAFWSDHSLFGGFKMGISVDNAIDKGLTQIASLAMSSVDYNTMQQCLARNNNKGDTSRNKNAQIYAAIQSPLTGTGFEYVIGDVDFTKTDPNDNAAIEFNPQRPPMGLVDKGTWQSVVRKRGTSVELGDTANGSVVRLKVKLGQDEAMALMAYGTSLELVPEPGSADILQAFLDDYNAKKTATPALDPAVIQAAKEKWEQLKAARDDPGKLTITVDQVSYGEGGAQKHLVRLGVSSTRVASLYDSAGTKQAPVIEITGFDARYSGNAIVTGGDPSVAATVDSRTRRSLVFTRTETELNGDANFFNAPPGSASIPDPFDTPRVFHDGTFNFDAFDYVKLDNDCEKASGAASGQSFGAAGWNVDFSDTSASARHSWNFANPAGDVGESDCGRGGSKKWAVCGDLIFDSSNSALTPNITNPNPYHTSNRADFGPRSIVENCVIKSSAMLVSGFFTCDTLEIEARTQPLVVIGTFIVNNLIVAPSVYKAGATFMSIYHPDAVPYLRNARLLRPTSDPATGSCTGLLNNMPIWAVGAMTPSLITDIGSCNASSLRTTADPFTWTAVDPDCGTLPNASNTSCKKHPMNYYIMEHGRGGGP